MVKSSVANSGVGLLGFCSVVTTFDGICKFTAEPTDTANNACHSMAFFIRFVMSEVILEFQSIREYS